MKMILAILVLVALSARAQFESPAMVGAMTAPVVSGGGGGQTKLQDVVDYAKTIPGVYAIYAASNGWFSSASGNATWTNLTSTAGLNLTNLTSGTSSQPVLNTSGLNGNAVLEFDGVGRYLNAENHSISQPNEYWLVVNISNVYSAGPYLYSGYAAPRQISLANIGTVYRMQMNAGSTARAGNNTWVTNKWMVVSHAYNGASSAIYTNNVAPTMGASDAGIGSQSGLVVGAYSSAYAYLGQSLAMVIVFSTNLDHTTTGVSSNLFNLITNCYGISL